MKSSGSGSRVGGNIKKKKEISLEPRSFRLPIMCISKLLSLTVIFLVARVLNALKVPVFAFEPQLQTKLPTPPWVA
jgi:hypothetical protein